MSRMSRASRKKAFDLVSEFDYGHPGRVIILQPTGNAWEFEDNWKFGLYNCCTDKKMCFCAFCCPCCFLCELFSRTNECLCTPIFALGSLMAFRTKLRTAFRIKGDIWGDFLTTTFCVPCSAIQITVFNFFN